MRTDKPQQVFFNNQIVGMMEVDADGHYLRVNRQWLKMIGLDHDEVIAQNFAALTHPDDLPRQQALDLQLYEGKRSSYRMDKRYIRKDGSILWCDLAVTAIYDPQRQLIGMVGLAVDITEKKAFEEQLKESEARFRTLINQLENIPIQGYDEQRQIIFWNGASTRLYGYSREEALGRKLEELIIPPHMRKDVIAAINNWRDFGERIPSGEATLHDKDGNPVPVYSSHVVHTTASGTREFYCIDIDLRMVHKAEHQIRQLAAAVEQSGETIVITDTNGIIEYVNPMFTTVTGYTKEEAIGQNPRILNAGKQDPSVYQELWETISQGKTWKGRFYNKKKNGDHYTENVTIFPIVNPAGEITNYVAVKQDITEQLLTEEKYRQAQKMETIGQLAGGVAHDFNNMLAIILGQVEIALMKLPQGDPLERRLQEIRSAATRSSTLTQQLLGFARKQSRQAQVLNLNDTVATMLTMLKRLIGENLDLHWIASAENSQVEIDPGHFNQILTNLIINARDSIDGAGVITVRTEEVILGDTFCPDHPGSQPGHCVKLSISDTGCGMDADTLQKIFEPFFTTKDVGKGTGLGLSMVYGLIKQNNGYIDVHSTPEEGSTFDLYFPRASLEEEGQQTPPQTEGLFYGNETILVVEDEQSLLNVTVAMLTEAGYSVLSAQGPFAAIQIAEKHKGEIDLLLTDIIMPKMDGVELGEYLKEIKDDIKVLYMSGYPRGHFKQQQRLDPAAKLLKKPFSAHKLTKDVRTVLDM